MITKYLIPIVAVIAFGGGSWFGTKFLDKKCPDLKCPEMRCPDCDCPPTLGNELEKVKGKYVTIQLHQNYQVDINGDSLVIERIRQAVKDELVILKVSRCK